MGAAKARAPDGSIDWSDHAGANDGRAVPHSASPAMRRVLAAALRAAETSIPILIEGESGVGKEWLARAIHDASPRAGSRLVTVNCGAIPEKLVESILFGHERGAFTGATEKHAGKFAEAHGGTLFLDEIGELPPEAQVKLLRAVQEGEVEPVGARSPRRVDVRIISATNRRLSREVAEGRFREDLFYRLGVFPILVPPLRERREDIAELARAFVRAFAERQGTIARDIEPTALERLCRRDWPGNIRELENTVFRATVLADRPTLGIEDFPPTAREAASEVTGDEANMLHAFEAALADDRAETDPVSDVVIDALDASGEMRPLSDIERQVIEMALDHYNGRMSQVARRLGIGRSTLYRKLREYGLQPR